jgi:hypothetical protein
MIRPALIALLVAFVAYGVTARASPSCKTFGEARVAYPGKHLWWHGRAKCWDDSGPSHRAGHAPLLPPQRPDRSPMLLFPTLVEGRAPDPQFLARDMSAEPLLIDIDAATAEPVDRCCWPALDEPPPATFVERWFAMPTIWIARHP